MVAQAIGAKLATVWMSSTCWVMDAGDRKLSNELTKSEYPLGIMASTKAKTSYCNMTDAPSIHCQ